MDKSYDVVIIGAGIAGLVCGCYLAKAGLKVLIVEKHDKPGGYCTSFWRKGYRFDVGVHYLGGMKRGALRKIVDDLDLSDRIRLFEFNPTDKIVLPDTVVYIMSDFHDTLDGLKKNFPQEKNNLERFFHFISENDFLVLYRKLKNMSFKNLLDSFFQDNRLKCALGVLLLNMGLSPAQASAISSVVLFREFVLDPSYYPEGGMGNFSMVIANRFKELGGELLCGTKCDKILIEEDKVKGVVINGEEVIDTDYVVSCIDASLMFTKMVDIDTKERHKISWLKPSMSLYVLYLGLKDYFPDEGYNLWFCDSYYLDEYYSSLEKMIKNFRIDFFMVSLPTSHDITFDRKKSAAQIYLIAPYLTEDFWRNNRSLFRDKLLGLIDSKKVFPTSHIDICVDAVPYTFYNYTFNSYGAAFGWMSTVEQTEYYVFPQVTSIYGLFLAGHWCTIGSGQGGIGRVAVSGYRASGLVLRKIRRKKFAL